MMDIYEPGVRPTWLEPGDLIFCHRNGFASKIIRLGESLRGKSEWSHVAVVEQRTTEEVVLIEALTKEVTRSSLSKYDSIRIGVVHTNLLYIDQEQAKMFARSCIGQKYGWWTILGISLRYLTPGRGLWFGMNGTEICSGLAAQCLVRGFYNFSKNPASMTPTELAKELK